MAVFEIPLTPDPQRFDIQLAGITYRLTFYWNAAPEGGWTLNIADSNDVAIINGIPLVTGNDLLAQYAYLNFGGTLIATTDDAPLAPPTFTNLGQASHVYFTTPDTA